MKIVKYILIYLLILISSYANEFTYTVDTKEIDENEFVCFTEWMIVNGKRVKPSNDNLKSMIIKFSNKMDNLTVKTTNFTGHYQYTNFVDAKALPVMGISYFGGTYEDHIIYDIFTDGVVLIWRNKDLLQRSNCPELRLNIKRRK